MGRFFLLETRLLIDVFGSWKSWMLSGERTAGDDFFGRPGGHDGPSRASSMANSLVASSSAAAAQLP